MALTLEDIARIEAEEGTPAAPPSPGLTLEDAERIDLEERTATLQARGRDTADRLREFNVGVARVLGLPVDAVSALIRVTGLDQLTKNLPAPLRFGAPEPFGGGASLQRGLSAIGSAPPPGEEGTDFEARLLQNVGASAVPAVGFIAKAPSALAAAGVVGREAVSALGATAGGEAARVAVEGFTGEKGGLLAQALGELAGGIAAPHLVGAAPRLAVGAGRRVVRAVRDPTRPARRVQSLAADPTEAARRITDPGTVGDLSPAARTRDPRLLSLEASAAETDPALAARLQDRMAAVAEEGRDLARLGGTPEDAVNFLQDLAATTAERARRTLERLSPRVTAREASERARTLVEEGLSSARDVERGLYAQVPDTVRVRLGRTLRTYAEELIQRTEVDDAGDIPGFVREFLGTIEEGKFTPGRLNFESDMQRVRTLRSRLLEASRAERALEAPNRNKLRILSDLSEALMLDLSASPGGESLATATAFSRNLNDRFTRGTVGELLGYERAGGVRTDPAATLESVLRRSGETQGVALRQLLTAAPEAKGSVEDFLKQSFIASATDPDTGRAVVPRAQKFLAKNQGALEELPELRAQFQEALKGQKEVDQLLGVRASTELTPLMRKKAAAGLFLDGNPDDAMKRVLRSGDVKLLRSLRDQVARDPSGAALRGLKASFTEELMRTAQMPSADIRGASNVSGARLRRVLRENTKAASALLDTGELNRLNRIVRTFEALDAQRAARPLREGVIADAPAQLMRIVARVTGAQVGRAVARATGGGTVQTPGVFSGQAARLLDTITNDDAQRVLVASVEDPDLFRHLLLSDRRLTPARTARLNALIRPHLAIPATTLVEESEAQAAAK